MPLTLEKNREYVQAAHEGRTELPSLTERAVLALCICIFFFACYGVANRLIPLSRCADLTTFLDTRIPFIPEFVYPFYLAYPLVFLPVALVRERSLLRLSTVAFLILFVLSFLLFFVIPVYVPRPHYVIDSAAGRLVKLIYSSDRPVCGFPSLHVSASLLAASILWREYRRVGALAFGAFLATSVSTLFIKQHVILDVIGGVILALAVDWAVIRHGMAFKRSLQAAVLNIRSMATRPDGTATGHITESRECTCSGIEYDLYEPVKTARSTCIIVHGITLQGERDHRLINFSRALAECGIRAAAIGLPALKTCRFEERDTQAIAELALELNRATGEKIGIIGFSMGAGIALTAATDPAVSHVIDPLLLFGPHYSLDEVWNSLLKHSAEQPRSEEEWDNYIWLRLVLAYRTMDSLELSEADKGELTERLHSYCFEPSLQKKREFYERVLKAIDIDRALTLVAAEGVPPGVSPKGKLGTVAGRVLILHDRSDGLIPPEQSQKIMAELSRNHAGGPYELCVTPLLSHVTAGSARHFSDIFRILRIMGELFR